MKNLLVVCAVLLLGGCAQVALNKPTASGKAEAEYQRPLSEVKSAVVIFCNNRGGIVEQETDRIVVCSKENTGGSGIMFQALMGNSYSTTPLTKARFTMFERDGVTKVWIDQPMETQMALGQVRSMVLSNNKVINRNQYILDNELPKYFK